MRSSCSDDEDGDVAVFEPQPLAAARIGTVLLQVHWTSVTNRRAASSRRTIKRPIYFKLEKQPKILFWDFRPLSQAFIRRSWYSDTTWTRRVKKAVVCVTEWIAALIPVHGLLSFFADVHGFFNPSRKSIWLSVDHRPINHGIFLSSMVGERGFVTFCSGYTLTCCKSPFGFWLLSCLPVARHQTSFQFHPRRSYSDPFYDRFLDMFTSYQELEER